MTSLREKLQALPKAPGVYIFKDSRGVVLYVGKAKSLRQRVASYFTRPPDLKTGILLQRVGDIEYLTVPSELDALILENDLIKQYQPRYNIVLKDDKAYPFLKLTVNEKWPRLFLTRKKTNDGALYFGRFQGKMVREVIRLVKKLFPIRWCQETPLRMRNQECLYYRLGACAGPCTEKISREDYLSLVKGIILFLKGKMAQAIAKLEAEMKKAAQQQDYELAAQIRDRIIIIQKMKEARDLRRAPAPRLLTEINELKTALNLKQSPLRIEAFDISNIQGANIVGALVTFYGGLPLKKDYRKFKIRGAGKKPNDVRGIYEIVKRRYSKTLTQKLPLPDLVLIDGGLAQVNFAAKALKEAGGGHVPVIGLAKRAEEIFWPGQIKPLKLSRSSPALKLLQRIRDEAHRFAVAYHRRRRTGSLFAS